MDAKEEVRSRLAIEEVIGEYVPLKRAGRSWKGLSPFSGEKTPSFFVSPDKQIWHDFSSNKGGDIFSFVMEVEGLDFRGALELLARKAGVDLAQYQTAGSQGIARKKQRMLEMHRLAVAYYQQCLVRSPVAIAYVSERRGMNRETVTRWQVGYAPAAGDALVMALGKKGYTPRELQEAGLAVSRRGGAADLFRDRIVLPLADGQGQVVGFTGRILDDNVKAPKYLNTPQTLLYDKGRQVFGLHLAKEAIRSADYAVVVEGNIDVLASHQAGVRQVVASAGTAMTEAHLKALARLGPHVRLAFDNDKAGVAATERAIAIAGKAGVELSIISLPDGAKDPDELIRRDPAAWQAAIDTPQPVVEWLIDYYRRQHDLSTAAGKKAVTTAALQVIRQLEDAVEQEHYLGIVTAATGVSQTALYDKLHATPAPAPAPKKVLQLPPEAMAGSDPHAYQDFLLGLGLYDTEARAQLASLAPDDLVGDDRRQVLGYLQAEKGRVTAEMLPPGLQPLATYVTILLFKAETRYQTISSTERMVEAVRLVRQAKHEQRKQTKLSLLTALREAEAGHDDAAAALLRQQLNQLIKDRT